MLLNCSNITKAFGTDVVIAPSSFGVNEGDRIGLVGANGAGKTTLFKLLTGELLPDGGEIFAQSGLDIKYLEQYAGYNTDKTVIGEVMQAFSDIIAVENELNDAVAKMQTSTDTELIEHHHALSEQYEKMGGFTYKSRAKAALLGLGFSESDFNKTFGELSGGQKTRVMLCKILLGGAGLLLLDEPTNHLDLESISWLEGFLSDYKGTFIVISHDRYFLDKVTNRIFDMDNGKVFCYNGNYTKYLVLKDEAEKTARRKYQNQLDEINRLEGIIKQQKQWNRERNIRTAESKQKSIDRIKADMESPLAQSKAVSFSFRRASGCGNEVLVCRELTMGFENQILFSDADLFIGKGDKVFLMGKNGCGKTTLIKIITGELSPKGGSVKLGSNVKIGYYDQTQQCLDLKKTPFEQIRADYPKLTDTEIRNALAAFLVTGDDVFKLIGDLSGGERARVSLLRLLLSGANFLILDEPTNHLDIRSREALETALSDYDGTVLAVSHDRYFIEKLATKIYNMQDGLICEYNGNYDYFINHQKPEEETKTAAKSGGESYKEQKRLESLRRKKENAIKRAEDEIAAAENVIAQLNQKLELPEIATDYVKANEIMQELDEKNKQLDALYESWQELNLQ